MGLCWGRPPRQLGEYDPMGSLIGGDSPIKDLSEPLRDLVKRGRVLFWRDVKLQTPAYYINLRTPFILESASGRRKVRMRRKQEEEDGDRLVFEGVCEQGFVYTLSITARVVSVHRWRKGRWTKRTVEYTAMLNWVKRPQSDTDYGVDYEMMLWR